MTNNVIFSWRHIYRTVNWRNKKKYLTACACSSVTRYYTQFPILLSYWQGYRGLIHSLRSQLSPFSCKIVHSIHKRHTEPNIAIYPCCLRCWLPPAIIFRKSQTPKYREGCYYTSTYTQTLERDLYAHADVHFSCRTSSFIFAYRSERTSCIDTRSKWSFLWYFGVQQHNKYIHIFVLLLLLLL